VNTFFSACTSPALQTASTVDIGWQCCKGDPHELDVVAPSDRDACDRHRHREYRVASQGEYFLSRGEGLRLVAVTQSLR
jgi:hypothetical protein